VENKKIYFPILFFRFKQKIDKSKLFGNCSHRHHPRSFDQTFPQVKKLTIFKEIYLAFHKVFLNNNPFVWRDSISRPIATISSVADGDGEHYVDFAARAFTKFEASSEDVLAINSL
jgi:hypothetical protein